MAACLCSPAPAQGSFLQLTSTAGLLSNSELPIVRERASRIPLTFTFVPCLNLNLLCPSRTAHPIFISAATLAFTSCCNTPMTSPTGAPGRTQPPPRPQPKYPAPRCQSAPPATSAV